MKEEKLCTVREREREREREASDHLLTQPVLSGEPFLEFRKGRIELSTRVQVAFIDTHDLSSGN